ncbi:hypothetical protein MTO96_036759 [Rhipicephalus appendiculatus]
MSRYPYSSSGFADDDAASGTSFPEALAHTEDPSDKIFDEYTETNPEWQVPCTAAEHRTCQIVDHLPALNELLCSIGLRLRELSDGDGQLALVKTLTLPFIPLREQVEQEKMKKIRCLAWLLKSHPCVTSMYVDYALLRELQEGKSYGLFECNNTLKSLKVDSRTGMHSFEDRRIISQVAQLEKLEIVISDIIYINYSDQRTAISEALRTKNLSALKVFCGGWPCNQEVVAFISALKASSTLRELSVDYRLLLGCGDVFPGYLENNSVLDSLNIYGSTQLSMSWVLSGMRKNRSVSKLSFFGCRFDCDTYLLLRHLLLDNAVLKSLTLSAIGDGAYKLSHEGSEDWLEALGKNEGLRYIRFPFEMIPDDRWHSLFETVSTDKSLKEVVVEVSGWQYNKNTFHPYILPRGPHRKLLDVCEMLERSGAKHKVTFTFMGLEPHSLAYDYPRPLSFPMPRSTMTRPPMDLIQQFCSFDSCRMTKLVVRPSLLGRHSSGVCQFIEETTTLKQLVLLDELDRNDPSVDSIWSDILESLSQNTSITDVTYCAKWERVEILQHLANVVKSSATIRTLKISVQSPSISPDCPDRLPVDISNNYSLCSFSLFADERTMKELRFDWLAWYKTSWRNSGIVARAARFVQGTMCDRHCAAGLDRVYRHPALLAELAEVLSIDEAEARERVREGFRSIEGLHDFMLLAGVVKEEVKFLPSEDGSTQLDALNGDCWSHVRRYLQLDDIALGSASPAQSLEHKSKRLKTE